MILPIQSNLCKAATLKKTKNGFQDQLSLNTGQKYCRMLQGEHSAIFSTFIKLPFVIKIIFVYFWVAVLHRFYCTVAAHFNISRPNKTFASLPKTYFKEIEKNFFLFRPYVLRNKKMISLLAHSKATNNQQQFYQRSSSDKAYIFPS